MTIISKFGEMWARNPENVKEIPGSKEGGQGVYILYDGSMPVYVGKGNIRQRIRAARDSPRRGQLWDYFSWYVLHDAALMDELEALLLRMLPFQLRVLNRQLARFPDAQESQERNIQAEPIERADFVPSDK